jgi:hypothetical protein
MLTLRRSAAGPGPPLVRQAHYRRQAPFDSAPRLRSGQAQGRQDKLFEHAPDEEGAD